MKLFPTRNPSSHAEAWKARAMAALRSNSSLSVRLRRYNEPSRQGVTYEPANQ